MAYPNDSAPNGDETPLSTAETAVEETTWHSRFVETDDGALLHVRLAGSGPPLVLLHGWSMSSAFWLRQSPLAEHYTLVCPDLRGHGHSSKILEGHTIPRYAKDVVAVLTTLGFEERVTLLGWSMAGSLALECWLRMGVAWISRLVLVESTPSPLADEDWNTHRLRGHDLSGLQRMLRAVRSDRDAHLERMIQRMFYAGKCRSMDGTEDALEWMLAEGLNTPAAIATAIYSDYALRDYTAVLPTVEVPALALYGDSPYLCFGPKTGGYVAGEMPGAELEVYSGSGHMPFWEEADRFNATLAAFLSA